MFFFVSSHKILSFLENFSEKLPDKKIAVCKEITKINEAIFVGLATEVLINFKKNTKNSLGEFVVITEGADDINKSKDDVNIEIYDTIKKLLKKFSLTDTVDIVHRIGNMSKNKLYKKALELQNEK